MDPYFGNQKRFTDFVIEAIIGLMGNSKLVFAETNTY